jgi:hypothetical protein
MCTGCRNRMVELAERGNANCPSCNEGGPFVDGFGGKRRPLKLSSWDLDRLEDQLQLPLGIQLDENQLLHESVGGMFDNDVAAKLECTPGYIANPELLAGRQMEEGRSLASLFGPPAVPLRQLRVMFEQRHGTIFDDAVATVVEAPANQGISSSGNGGLHPVDTWCVRPPVIEVIQPYLEILEPNLNDFQVNLQNPAKKEALDNLLEVVGDRRAELNAVDGVKERVVAVLVQMHEAYLLGDTPENIERALKYTGLLRLGAEDAIIRRYIEDVRKQPTLGSDRSRKALIDIVVNPDEYEFYFQLTQEVKAEIATVFVAVYESANANFLQNDEGSRQEELKEEARKGLTALNANYKLVPHLVDGFERHARSFDRRTDLFSFFVDLIVDEKEKIVDDLMNRAVQVLRTVHSNEAGTWKDVAKNCLDRLGEVPEGVPEV